MDLTGYVLLDSHCHPIWREDPEDYSSAFSEAHDSGGHARHGLFYRRSLREMAELLGCSPERMLAERQRLSRDELFARCVQGIDELLLDDGLTPDRCLPLDWHARHVRVRRLLRIEQVAERLYTGGSYADFLERFVSELQADVAGYKSVAAYRTGLDVDPGADGAEAYREWKGERLSLKPLNDHLVGLTLEQGKTVQFHTGFGDPDLDLRTANPLCLRPLIERYPGTKIVLLHAGYPFVREAGFLASVYPNVYLDFGLAVPFLSVAGMRRTVSQLLELGPLSKLTWSSDASRIPDLYYLGARWGKRILGEVLDECIANGDLTASEAEDAARSILTGQDLYRSVL